MSRSPTNTRVRVATSARRSHAAGTWTCGLGSAAVSAVLFMARNSSRVARSPAPRAVGPCAAGVYAVAAFELLLSASRRCLKRTISAPVSVSSQRRSTGSASHRHGRLNSNTGEDPSPRPQSPGHRGSARMGACEWLYGQRSRSNPASDPGSLQRPRVDKFQTPNRQSGPERNPDFVRPWRVQPSIDRTSASTSRAGAAELHGLIPPSGYPQFISS